MSGIILGAGAAGIGAGYQLSQEQKIATIYEQRPNWGGLCDSFVIDGFRFDTAVHLSFTTNEFVKSLFEKSTKYFVHKPDSTNYFHGHWLKHPVQNNLFPLPPDFKTEILLDFIENANVIHPNPKNYQDWLVAQYGPKFCEHFPLEYTKKYWTVPAENLTTDWVSSRMYRPTIKEVLMGAMTDETPNTYYAKEMRYPVSGGYREFLSYAASHCNFKFNKRASQIDSKKKIVIFSDGDSTAYEYLISSLPLPEIVKLLENVPEEVLEAGEKLLWTSVALVSLGFKKPDIPKDLWFYIYDMDKLPSRAYSPSIKSPNNVPQGCSSLQFEIYHSRLKPLPLANQDLIDHVIQIGEDMKLFQREDIVVTDYRNLKYGNVVFDFNLEESRKIILDFLKERDIQTIGRFGHWDYYWSDQSFMSGVDCAKALAKQKHKEV